MKGASALLRRLVCDRTPCCTLAARSSSITHNLVLTSTAASSCCTILHSEDRLLFNTIAPGLSAGFHSASLDHHRSFSSLPSSSGRLLSPIIGQLSEKFPHVTICKIDINKLTWGTRNFAQPARAEDEEEEEVEIDQRRLPADYDPTNFDPTEHRSPPSERVWRLVDEISGLTLAEAGELSSIMMRKLGMKEMPVVGVMKPGTAGAVGKSMNAAAATKEETKPEKTAFELKLESFDAASKLKVIKEIRSFTDLGLKEAKDLVEKVPAIIKKGVPKEDAEKIIEKMKAVGAVVIMD